jgi:hypothetical protein
VIGCFGETHSIFSVPPCLRASVVEMRFLG